MIFPSSPNQWNHSKVSDPGRPVSRYTCQPLPSAEGIKKPQRHLGKGGIPGWGPRIGNHGKWRKSKKSLDFGCELCVSVGSSALAVHRRLLRIWAPEMKCIPEFSACFVPFCLHVDVRSPVPQVFLGGSWVCFQWTWDLSVPMWELSLDGCQPPDRCEVSVGAQERRAPGPALQRSDHSVLPYCTRIPAQASSFTFPVRWVF